MSWFYGQDDFRTPGMSEDNEKVYQIFQNYNNGRGSYSLKNNCPSSFNYLKKLFDTTAT